MSELHSLSHTYARSYSSNNNDNLHSSNSLCWKSHDHLGFLNADSLSLAMEDDNNLIESSLSPTESDISTGYLEDALLEFTNNNNINNNSKRRRLLFHASNSEDYYTTQQTHPHQYTTHDLHLKGCSAWGSSYCTWDDNENETMMLGEDHFNSWISNKQINHHHMISSYDAADDHQAAAGAAGISLSLSSCSPKSRINEESYSNLKTPELERFSNHPYSTYEDYPIIQNCSSSSSKRSINNKAKFLAADTDKQTLFSSYKDHKPTISGRCDSDNNDTDHHNTKNYKKKKKKRRVVVYPFALVKPGPPGGGGGERECDNTTTLNEINEKMLMAPTRPVRHPVGDFACRPCVSLSAGVGLSGKLVVALTRIHTLGRRGTITIIRTKG